MSIEPATPPLSPYQGFRIQRLIRAIREFNWKYVLIEFVIVVAGILSAFAWNSWWERRNQESRATAYLEQILAELQDSEADLEQVISSMQKRLHAAAQLSRASFTTDPPSESQLREWFFTNMFYETPSITSGTLRAMISSGDIHLIQDQKLKTKLSSTADLVTAYENWSRDQVTEWLLPAWHDMHPYARFTALQMEMLHPDSVTAYALKDSMYLLPVAPRIQPFPIQLTRDLSDPAFHDLVLDVYVARWDLLQHTEELKKTIVQLRINITNWLETVS